VFDKVVYFLEEEFGKDALISKTRGKMQWYLGWDIGY